MKPLLTSNEFVDGKSTAVFGEIGRLYGKEIIDESFNNLVRVEFKEVDKVGVCKSFNNKKILFFSSNTKLNPFNDIVNIRGEGIYFSNNKTALHIHYSMEIDLENRIGEYYQEITDDPNQIIKSINRHIKKLDAIFEERKNHPSGKIFGNKCKKNVLEAFSNNLDIISKYAHNNVDKLIGWNYIPKKL
jgi:hypothetical protein